MVLNLSNRQGFIGVLVFVLVEYFFNQIYTIFKYGGVIIFLENQDFYHYLYDKLGIKIDDHNMDIQEEYFKILDKVIDACVLVRYQNNCNHYTEYHSIDQINTLIIEKIEEGVSEKELLEYLSNVFIGMISQERDLASYYYKLKELYQNYSTKRELDYSVTTEFYNEILNKQRNFFLSQFKETIKEGLKALLPYTERMSNKLETNLKFKKCLLLLKNRNYSLLGITQEEINEKLDHLHLYLNMIKPFNKNNRQLSSSILEGIDSLFLDGKLLDENLKKGYPFLETKERKVILNQYHKLLLPYLESIEIEPKGNSLNVAFNYNHYQIVSEKGYQ